MKNTDRQDDDSPVTVATYPNPHEAQLARAALESYGIPAVVDNDHGQYPTAASWVHLQVALRDCDLADTVLEQGPLSLTPEGTEIVATDATADPNRTDDMRSLRLQRRFTLARWFLYWEAFGLALAGWILVPLFVLPLGLALWSRSEPRRAFGVALALQTILTVVAISTSGFIGLTTLIPLLAVYFARAGAVPDPPETLLASPLAMTRAIDIGDAWQTAAADHEPGERRVRFGRAITIAAIVVAALWGGWLLMRTTMVRQGLAGATDVVFQADSKSALEQALRWKQAQLAHELQVHAVPYDAILIAEPHSLEIAGIDRTDGGNARTIAVRMFPGWTVEDTTDGSLRVAMTPQVEDSIVEEAFDEALTQLQALYGATVVSTDDWRAGTRRARVRLTGEWTPAEIHETFDEPLTLEFRAVRYPAGVRDTASWIPSDSPDGTRSLFEGRLPPGTELVEQSLQGNFAVYWPLAGEPVIVGRDLLEVTPTTNMFGDPTLAFRLSEAAGRRLEAASRRMIGRKMAIVLRGAGGGRVVSVPIVQGAIGAEG